MVEQCFTYLMRALFPPEFSALFAKFTYKLEHAEPLEEIKVICNWSSRLLCIFVLLAHLSLFLSLTLVLRVSGGENLQ